jgi:hypothetical protein
MYHSIYILCLYSGDLWNWLEWWQASGSWSGSLGWLSAEGRMCSIVVYWCLYLHWGKMNILILSHFSSHQYKLWDPWMDSNYQIIKLSMLYRLKQKNRYGHMFFVRWCLMRECSFPSYCFADWLLFACFQCFDHLTQWSNLEEFTVTSVDDSDNPNLEKVWDDTYFQVSVLCYIYYCIYL